MNWLIRKKLIQVIKNTFGHSTVYSTHANMYIPEWKLQTWDLYKMFHANPPSLSFPFISFTFLVDPFSISHFFVERARNLRIFNTNDPVESCPPPSESFSLFKTVGNTCIHKRYLLTLFHHGWDYFPFHFRVRKRGTPRYVLSQELQCCWSWALSKFGFRGMLQKFVQHWSVEFPEVNLVYAWCIHHVYKKCIALFRLFSSTPLM